MWRCRLFFCPHELRTVGRHRRVAQRLVMRPRRRENIATNASNRAMRISPSVPRVDCYHPGRAATWRSFELGFAFPAIRNAVPGGPPIGALMDFLALFWAEVVVALSLTAVIATWLFRKTSAAKA